GTRPAAQGGFRTLDFRWSAVQFDPPRSFLKHGRGQNHFGKRRLMVMEPRDSMVGNGRTVAASRTLLRSPKIASISGEEGMTDTTGALSRRTLFAGVAVATVLPAATAPVREPESCASLREHPCAPSP